MHRRNVRPEQLHLELQYDYLKWLNNTSEEVNIYETITSRFFKTSPSIIRTGDNLYWSEITNQPDIFIRF